MKARTLSRPSLMDCHVHLDDIRIYNPSAAERSGIKPGEIRYKNLTIDGYVRHVANDNLDTIFAIYEDHTSILDLRKRVPECDVKGMLWPRDVSDPHLIEKCGRLYEMGLLQALKVHPVLDNFDLTAKNLEKVLFVARKYDIPVLYHSDDRKDTMELTSPEKQRALIEENKDVIFIIGHGGAYAHPRLYGENNPAARGYWASRKGLIGSALELTAVYDNVFYDVTICTNKAKARIIADFVNGHPSVAGKILIGTDFPILRSSARSQLKALEKAGMKPAYLDKIASNRGYI